jgi:hypothetical protein
MESLERVLQSFRNGEFVLEELRTILLGNPIILPTSDPLNSDVEVETGKFYERVCEDFQNAIQTLREFGQNTDSRQISKQHYEDVLQNLEGAFSMVRGVHQALKDAFGQEFPTSFPDIAEGRPLPAQYRAINEMLENGLASPIPMQRSFTRRYKPHEESNKCYVRPNLPCVWTKEFFGWMPRLFRRRLPIYAEPWYRRNSRIIGYRIIWYIRWVPVEYLKSIIHQLDSNGRVEMKIEQKLVTDSQLANMWAFHNVRE